MLSHVTATYHGRAIIVQLRQERERERAKAGCKSHARHSIRGSLFARHFGPSLRLEREMRTLTQRTQRRSRFRRLWCFFEHSFLLKPRNAGESQKVSPKKGGKGGQERGEEGGKEGLAFQKLELLSQGLETSWLYTFSQTCRLQAST